MLIDQTTNHWAILRFQIKRNFDLPEYFSLSVEYRDSLGEKHKITQFGYYRLRTSGLVESSLYYAEEFSHFLEKLINEASFSVPVFLEPPEGFTLIRFNAKFGREDYIRYLLGVNDNRIQIVHLVKENRRVQRAPFTMPLKILTIGENCENSLGILQDTSWYRNNPNVRKYGIVFDTYKPEKTSRKLLDEAWDIILIEPSSLDFFHKIV